ncbi:hypothetical protein [Mesoaciditoga lauensis]|uniref:hypothetical protein n=1 Tax=Mesoaciditoga lauensis TaxID=1495039 RepID=UPI00055CFBFC|nr:hypothetical protein [Mesoaciditoga lauensis]
MQKRSLLFATLLMLFLTIGIAFSQQISMKMLALQTTKTASSIVTYRAGFVYARLEKGLEGIKRLKKAINEKRNGENPISTSTIIEEAKDVFQTLYQQYKEIDENSTSIREGFEKLIQQASKESTQAENQVRLLERQLAELKEKLKNSSDPDVQKSLRSQIEILQERIKVWIDFKNTVSQLPLKSKKLEENIMYFFKIIHLSVPVYYQAYMALSEIEDIRNFLEDVKTLSHLDILSGEIERSWSDISEIVKSIKSISQISGLPNTSVLQVNQVKILHENFFGGVIEFFKMIWNFFFPAKIYTWEDVAKLAKEMSDNLKFVIEEL